MKIRTLVSVALMAVSTQVLAQQPAKKPSQQKKVEAASQESLAIASASSPQTPFTPTFFDGSKPVSAYQVNEPIKVYEWLSKYIGEIPGKPDQFSTTEEKRAYETSMADRLKSIGQIPVIGKCVKKYDGDLQRYEIKSSIHPIKNHYSVKEIDAPGQNVKVLSLSTENLKRDTYMAQNGYGAETQVSRTVADIYALAFPLSRAPASIIVDGSTRLTSIPLPYDVDFRYLQFNVKMPAADARNNDKDIVCLFIFSIEPPYILKFSDRSSPTRDLPFENRLTYYAIYGSLNQVAIINKASGEVYEQAAR